MVKGIMIWWSIVVKPQPREAPCSSPSARPGTASTKVPPSLCFKVEVFFFYRSLFILLFFSLMHFHSCFKFTITETATLLTWSSLRFRHSLSVSSLERKVNMLQQKCGVWNTKALHCRFSGDFNWVSVFNLSQCPTTLFSIYKNLTTIFQLLFLSSKQWHRQLAQLTTGSPPVLLPSPSSVLLRPVQRTKPHPTLKTGFTALG